MSRTQQLSGNAISYNEYKVGSNPTVFSATSRTASYTTVIRSDIVKTAKVPAGFPRPHTNYSADIRQMKSPFGVITDTYDDGSTRITSKTSGCLGDGGLQVRTHPGHSTGLRSKTEVKALLKLKDQSINLAQAFAERQQTVDLLYTAADTILNSVRALKKGNVRHFKKMLEHYTPGRALREGNKATRKMANRWLENAYGWTPAMADFHGATEALSKAGDDPKGRFITVNARSTERGVSSRTGTFFGPMSFVDYEAQRCSVTLIYELDNPLLVSLSSLGLTNPAYLAWELVPFSFVVDWALPVGDWLSSLDAAVGYRFYDGSRSQVSQLRQQMEYVGGKINSTKSFSGRFSNKPFYRTKLMTRTKYLSSPIPSPPGLKNPVSLAHAANALALMRGLLR